MNPLKLLMKAQLPGAWGAAVLAAGLATAPAGPSAAQGWRERPWWEDGERMRQPPMRAWRGNRDFETEADEERDWRRARPLRPYGRRFWGAYDAPYADPDAVERWDGEDAPPSLRRRAAPRDRWQDEDAGGNERRYEFDEQNDQDASGNGKPAGASGGARPLVSPRAPTVVPFAAGSTYRPGSIVIDTSARRLYYVRSAMSAFAYPIGVGRDGFSWTGREKVSRIAEWPDWYPPAEMRKRKPELPERMLGGLNNPLGAKAIYLGNTLYRIHGTNDPKSIGRAESSGCFRMMNAHVVHLASLVSVGTEVTVVRSLRQGVPSAQARVEQKPRLTQRPRPAPRIRWDDDPDPNPTFPEDDARFR